MKRIITFAILVSLVGTLQQALGQTYPHQLGLRLGSADQVVASGISYRYHFSENQAIEGILNFNNTVSLGVLYEKFQPLATAQNLKWFYGAGGYVGFKGRDNFGVTGIIGLDYQFPEDVPINVSVDWKPELNIVDAIRFRASTVGVSIRFSLAGKKSE
jgi:outer membrane protein W